MFEPNAGRGSSPRVTNSSTRRQPVIVTEVTRNGEDVLPAPWDRKGGGPGMLPFFGCLIHRISRRKWLHGDALAGPSETGERHAQVGSPDRRCGSAHWVFRVNDHHDDAVTSKTPPVSSASTTGAAPTAEQTARAAQVCTATATVKGTPRDSLRLPRRAVMKGRRSRLRSRTVRAPSDRPSRRHPPATP